MIKPYGSILSSIKDVSLYTADGIEKKLRGGFLQKAGLSLLGVPHLGLRLRANILTNWLSPVREGIILDAGGGIGLYTLTLADEFKNFILLDNDLTKLLTAKKLRTQLSKINIFIICGSIEHPPFKENIFNAVLCSEVIEHVKNDTGALAGFYRIMKPAAHLFLSTTHAGSSINISHRSTFKHERDGYTAEALKHLFNDNNFKIRKFYRYGGKWGQVFWKLNRLLFDSPFFLTVSFYPFYFMARIENILNPSPDPIGYIVHAVKSHDNKVTDNIVLEKEKYATKNPVKKLLIIQLIQEISRLVQQVNPVLILDAGCGTGYFGEKVLRPGPERRVIGVDVDLNSLMKTTKTYRHAVCASAAYLPFKPGVFDCVMSVEMLEHLETPDAAIGEINRVSRKWVIVSVPNEPLFSIAALLSGKYINRLGKHPDHRQSWSKKRFINWISGWIKPCAIKTPFPWTVISGKIIEVSTPTSGTNVGIGK